MRFIKSFLVAVLVFAFLGCEEIQQRASDYPSRAIKGGCLFWPQRIKFNQLTELKQPQQIKAFVDVFDQFDSRMKASGVWRFELYDKAVLSAETMGSRIRLWPDIELTEAKVNQSYWRDYLHCYEFSLTLESELPAGKIYILQAVYFTAEGKRITDTIELKS